MGLDLFAYDEQEGIRPLCGVDEAGRGPLAGDVFAAAVIFLPEVRIEGLNDSKKLTPRQREALYEEIREKAAAYAVATASVEEIERLNILNAALLAMRRAVEALSIRPGLVLVDGNRTLHLEGIHSRCVVKGDSLSASIAAASILAKVERDRYMEALARQYPQYRFEQHKGYGTALHYQMLDAYGPSPVHRLSFLKRYQSGEASPREESPKAIRGRMGEAYTRSRLEKAGYAILEQNFRCSYGEIDLIAAKDGILAFVEVKARTLGAAASPREAVGVAKRKRLLRTAAFYLQQPEAPALQPRFDVAEVLFAKGRASSGKEPAVAEFHYIENAFGGEEYEEP